MALLGGGAGVCAWQWGEHQRFKEASAQALVNRGRDITSTLGIVVSSQRRFGNLVSKDRIELALQGLIHPGELESVGILGATGETIASAGRAVELTPEMLRAGGVYWREHELTLMNLMDLGVYGGAADDKVLPAAVVISGSRMTKALRSPPNRTSGSRGPEARPPGSAAVAPGSEGAAPPPRFPYSRPPWMDKEEYDALIKTQGVHSLVISLSTEDMRRVVRGDFLLRALVSAMASGAALISALAWRNVSRNSELQIRLVKAGEMNSHLAQMNFAAAGLAHETRNPLNLIRGLAQMIALQAQDAPKLKEHASAIVEEADRVTVQLNQKSFGAISVFLQAAYDVEPGHKVAAACFFPRPDVESHLLNLARRPAPFVFTAPVKTLIRGCFQQRRKQIGALLRARLPDPAIGWRELLRSHGLSEQSRPEEIPGAWWQEASHLLSPLT